MKSHNLMPTQIGDMLILSTKTHAYGTYAVGPVVKDGQQGLDGVRDVEHFTWEADAIGAAKAMHGRRIFNMNIDTGEWTEVAR